jgi:uncharacterized protein
LALIELIQQHHPEAAFALVEQNPELADEKSSDGVSAAMLALYFGQTDLAEAILQHKASLDLFEAAAFGKLSECESIVRGTEDLSSFSPDGFQPLHLASFFGRTEVVRFFLSKRAPLNLLSQNPLGVAPLHSALANGHESIARELIFEGADVNLASMSGWTSLHYAAWHGNRPLTLFLKEHGAITQTNADGKSPQDLAIEHGHTDLVSHL